MKRWNFYIKASTLLCLLSVNTGFLWLVHLPLSRYHVIVEAGLHPPHQSTPRFYGASFPWPQLTKKEMLLLRQVESTQERDGYWRCVSMRLLAGNCSYWLPIKTGWVTSAFQATQRHQLPSHKKIMSSYVATTDAATPPLWCRFGVKTRQGYQCQTKARWLVMKHDNKRCRTNYCYKNRVEQWRRVGQIGLLPFRHTVHQHVLPGMSSTSICAHLRRKPKQLCVFCAVRWLSGEGGYLGWGSSHDWSSTHVLKGSNLEVPPVPGKM